MGNKICCHAMPVIDNETGRHCRLCTYFSNPAQEDYQECADEYCEECAGYKSREQWIKERREKNEM